MRSQKVTPPAKNAKFVGDVPNNVTSPVLLKNVPVIHYLHDQGTLAIN